MTQTIQAKDITLHDLKTRFQLVQTEELQFFREWQDGLPEIAADEKHSIDRIKRNYNSLIEYPPLLENAVKMVVLSPLLDLAGFYQPPFRIETEASIDILSEDAGVTVKGKIDVLVLNQQLWILAIESKRADFSLEAARAQVLAYMLSSPNLDKPVYGLITNGNSFVFLKLLRQQSPKYALSRVFSLLSPGNELENVLGILKQIGSAIAN